jgi:hypothetical protein
MYDANLKRRLEELVGPIKAVNKDDTSTTPTPSATTSALDTILGGTQYNANKKMAEDYRKQYDNHTFNFNGNALYNQYKGNYEKQAKMGMEDAIGRAAALTGGYGNSYAQSVGQQAYYNQMDKLNDRMLDLYKIAYGQYSDEKSDLLDKAKYYGGLAQQDYDNALKLFKLNSADEAPVSLEGLERIEEELKQAKTMEQVNNILDKWASAMTPDQEALLYDLYWRDESGYKNADGTYNYYNMLKNANAWKAGADGGTNYFGKIDGDAELISPFGEILTGGQLLDKLRRENISDQEAIDLIVELQKLYGINE